MKMSLFTVAAASVAAIALTGCVDDDYDLSDIDSTAQFTMKDLVLPLNLDDITLSDVLDLEEGSRIQVVNGEYVLMEDGTFASENIVIDKIEIDAPVVNPSEQTISLDQSVGLRTQAVADDVVELWYNIAKSSDSHFDYEVGNVSDHITSIDNAGVDLTMTIGMTVSGLEDYITGFEFRDMVFQFPKGLTLEYDASKYEYDYETGVFKFKSGYYGKVTGTTYNLTVTATEIDFNKANAKYDGASHSMVFSDDVSILSGKAHVTSNDFKPGHSFADMPMDVRFLLGFEFSDMTVNRFSGGVQYAIDGIDIAPIEMTDIPDFINQGETDIRLKNPQLYLSVNNPVAPFGLAPRTGLAITQIRGGEYGNSYSIDNGVFSFGIEQGNVDYNYCLAPQMPATVQAGYDGASFVPFTGLSEIVSGEGFPTALKVSVENPEISGTATGFDLGQELELHGKYLFYAPLDLTAGSTIVYTDTRDGWSDENLDRLTIYTMEISATASSDVPFSVSLDGYPINTAGDRIESDVEGVEIEARAEAKDITLRITGKITDLDGITFTARAVSDGTAVLTPGQKIVLKNVKVKVSGNYTDEL